jgi:PAT family beta-lactamase induction signal transducer AmpG
VNFHRREAGAAPGWAAVLCSGRMLITFLMGFSCGLPLLLTSTLLQAWLQEAGVGLTYIGLTALLGLPYTLKFLWAPFIDRFTPPLLGRRRGWLAVSQGLLALAIGGLGGVDPLQPAFLAMAGLAVAVCSATQDIVVDAYRREALVDRELGLGASLYVNGYRLGMLLASGGGLILADHFPFPQVYRMLSLGLLPGLLTTLLAPEPPAPAGRPVALREAVVDPLLEYFQRPEAWWILAFILCYKIGDTMAGAMTMPFYLALGFSKTQIGAVVKFFGFWATLGGGFLGGLLMLRLGISRSLWLFGALQAVSTAGFAVLAGIGPNLPALAAVIASENLTAGMGTSAFVAFMASITHRKFTATQYALLSSLMGIPRVLAAAPTGWLAQVMGWAPFFLFCTLSALPGMALLPRFAPWSRESARGDGGEAAREEE